MKTLFKILFLSTFVASIFASCKKEENKVLYEGGTTPTLSVSSLATQILTIANKDNIALSFNWTNPNYKFNTGTSSQDVTYTLQFDTTGASFTNPKIGQKAISKDLSTSLTVKELNTILLGMNLAENITHNMEMRIKSSLVNSSAVLYSNVLKIVVTPYLDVVYPVPTALWITGSATPLSWQCGCSTDVGTTQKFTKIGSSKFELTIALSANNSYLFLPQYGSWSAKYGFTGSNNSNNVFGDDFKPEGGDMKAPVASGTYKITVDFKTGKWSIQ